MNFLFACLLIASILLAASHTLHSSNHDHEALLTLTQGMLGGSGEAIAFVVQLMGVLCFFLGLMQVAEASGILRFIARVLHPVLRRLFPDVPPGHPAMGAMVMNCSANMLGLGNAATPFGLKAMQALNTLNSTPHVATRAMILFLAINASSITLLPMGVIALRASAGAANPAAVVPMIWIATTCSTLTAVVSCWLLSRWHASSEPPAFVSDARLDHQEDIPAVFSVWQIALLVCSLVAGLFFFMRHSQTASAWLVPGLVLLFVGTALYQRVPVYEKFVMGANEGLMTGLRIAPYLIAIFVLLAALKTSGLLDAFTAFVGPWTAQWGMPAEIVPLAVLRPLSGSGSYALLSALITDPNIGVDSYAGVLAATLHGSTETTFYVLAVYFGAAQVTRFRYALTAALLADLAGCLGSILAVSWLGGF